MAGIDHAAPLTIVRRLTFKFLPEGDEVLLIDPQSGLAILAMILSGSPRGICRVCTPRRRFRVFAETIAHG